jgi:hypothetical protein
LGVVADRWLERGEVRSTFRPSSGARRCQHGIAVIVDVVYGHTGIDFGCTT